MSRFIITFGQQHAHRVNGITFDKDSVAIIEALNNFKAREIAFSLFDAKFHQCVEEELYDKDGWDKYFPRGKFPANFKEERGTE